MKCYLLEEDRVRMIFGCDNLSNRRLRLGYCKSGYYSAYNDLTAIRELFEGYLRSLFLLINDYYEYGYV